MRNEITKEMKKKKKAQKFVGQPEGGKGWDTLPPTGEEALKAGAVATGAVAGWGEAAVRFSLAIASSVSSSAAMRSASFFLLRMMSI